MCGEMILATAAKCRYCGEIFDPALKKAQAKKSKKYGPDDETISTVEMILAVLCSGIGCIFGLVWMIQGKPKGMKMVGLSVVMMIFWAIFNAVLMSALTQPGGP